MLFHGDEMAQGVDEVEQMIRQMRLKVAFQQWKDGEPTCLQFPYSATVSPNITIDGETA